MKCRTQLWFVLFTGLFLLNSCYPGGPDEIDEYDIVETQYDEDYDFSQNMYYLMPDTISLIGESDGVYDATDQEIDLTILSEIEEQMTAAGYTRLSLADTADANKMEQAVLMLVSKSTVDEYSYYYDYYYYGYRYWDWYYGFDYYYPNYRWGYHYPWGYPVTYSHSVGTVIINMVDPNDPFSIDDTNGEVDYTVRWMAVFNGLAEGTLPNYLERIENGIAQAFDQSPYL